MKFKNYFFLYLPAMLMLATSACKKNAPKPVTDVYVAGTVVADNGIYVAAYWKNGVVTKLSDGKTDCFATGIIVKGNDIFVSGNYGLVPVYWKNGVEKKLTDGTSSAYAYGIAVNANNDVYVAGMNIAANGLSDTAVYWKNGAAAIQLSPGVVSSAVAVAANETGVYFGGYIKAANGTVSAVYWKDGVVTNLGDGSISSFARAIALHGSDVYLGGAILPLTTNATNREIVYWKNSDKKAIPFTEGSTDSFPLGMATNGTDVYICGFKNNVGDTGAAYWKNGTIVNLTDGQQAEAIALHGSDVYVAGYTAANEAVYWKNGIINHLTGGYEASGIAVVTH